MDDNIHKKIQTQSDVRVIGLFGHPVAHSKSPQMHNAAFGHLGLPYVYMTFDVHSDGLEKAVESIRELDMRGVNVTIPHKVDIIPYLDEITEEAHLIGAVNTVVNEQGRLIGHNTDGIGYVQSLMEETGLDLTKTNALVLGAGGAARAIVTSLALHGTPSIVIANRTLSRAQELSEHLRHLTKIHSANYTDLNDIVSEVNLIVNTTSVGMHPHTDECPIDPKLLQEHHIVSDLIYNPRETLLLLDAAKRGARTHGGLGMFVNQGAAAFALWTGVEPPVDVMKRTVESFL